jgi:hypothetical protein
MMKDDKPPSPPATPDQLVQMAEARDRVTHIVKADWASNGEPATMIEKWNQINGLVQQLWPDGFPDRTGQ